MAKRILIVDGYNVVHGARAFDGMESGKLEDRRRILIRYCSQWRVRGGGFSEVYVVFDGDSSAGGFGDETVGGVQVVFTATNEEADDRIRALVDGRCRDSDCVVVTDDKDLAQGMRGRRARVMTVADFCAADSGAGAGTRSGEDMDKPGLSPEDTRRLNDDLLKAWGIG